MSASPSEPPPAAPATSPTPSGLPIETASHAPLEPTRTPTDAPTEIAYTPTTFEVWAELVVPSFVGLMTLFVAIVSLVIARRALKISSAADTRSAAEGATREKLDAVAAVLLWTTHRFADDLWTRDREADWVALDSRLKNSSAQGAGTALQILEHLRLLTPFGAISEWKQGVIDQVFRSHAADVASPLASSPERLDKMRADIPAFMKYWEHWTSVAVDGMGDIGPAGEGPALP